MSKELPSNKNTNDEIDLIVFFNLIGTALNKVFVFIGTIFKGIYSVFISISREIFLNLKLIVGVAVVSIIIGYIVDKNRSTIYYSEMFIKPYFDSKYELINNVNYYNSLIENNDVDELSKLFSINKEESKSLVEFKIEIGPESQNEQLTDFNGFLKTLDSSTRSKITFKDYIENRNLYHAKIYMLRAKSKNYKIFKKLETGLAKSIKNDYSNEVREQREEVLKLEEQNLKNTLEQITNLKEAYLKVIEKESNKNSVTSSIGNTLGLQVEKTETKEDVLLQQEIETLKKLNDIKKELVVNDKVFDKISSFKEKGLVDNIWYKRAIVIFPIFAVFLLGLFNNLFKFYKHTLNF